MQVWAGGSGLNVAVVVNQNSTNSVQLGNYFCERRQVPPQNFFRINWPGGNSDWTLTDFNSYLLSPFQAMLAARSLTNQIDYVVLSMDIPTRVNSPSSLSLNSTTAVLFYGFKADTNQQCSVAPDSSNLYAGSEGIFRLTTPTSSGSNAFMVTMITASNFPLAKLVVDQGVASDGTFPSQPVFLAKSSDVYRNVRYFSFDNAIFNTRLRGNYDMRRIAADSISFLGNILGAQTGTFDYSLADVSFAPGAIVDNLTSYGGVIFIPNGGHLNILSLLAGGATGTYGTVDEPCSYLEKFPSPQDYFYQSRGFSLAECYYQSLANPYQGLILCEPLAAPFAKPAAGSWTGLPQNSLFSGTTNLNLQFTAADPQHLLQQVDLFVDGTWFQTLTNIPPSQNSLLSVNLNEHAITYTVPAGATVQSVTADLGDLLDSQSNSTLVAATAYGDRLELSSLDLTTPGPQVPVTGSSSPNGSGPLTVFLTAGQPSFLDTIASGLRNFVLSNAPPAGSSLNLTVTKTNGTQFTLNATNSSGDTTLSNLVQQLVVQINSDTDFLGLDGLHAEDFVSDVPPPKEIVEFNLVPNTLGWAAAEIQVSLTASPGISVTPLGTVGLDQNLEDLQPRNHLYVTAGVTNLSQTFSLDTTTLLNGFHELTAVVYEGSHVRTQKRVSQTVRVQNGPLSATFTTVFGDTNTALEATLQFQVTANTNNIARIDLFSTGGVLASVSGEASPLFSVAGTNLDLGLHPFYAVVTDAVGQQYRTETKWIRLVGNETPFLVGISASPARLQWAAAAGRRYDILSTTDLGLPFVTQDTLTASNSIAQWADTNALVTQKFYRVRASN
jgi:uncharacterized protein (TIGR03790 family)